MAKIQAKQEPAAEEPEVWAGDELAESDDAANDSRSAPPARHQPDMRHKIEDLIESRRLRKQISDYEFLDVDETPARRAQRP